MVVFEAENWKLLRSAIKLKLKCSSIKYEMGDFRLRRGCLFFCTIHKLVYFPFDICFTFSKTTTLDELSLSVMK